ncbi:MAG: aminoglycoside phosphotransferase family protein [Pseudomonadota bacterium]
MVAELGLGDVQSVVPLTGGVASDIAVVDLGTRRLCVKFALSKLRVAEDWQAPLHRNRAEYAWLQFAAAVAPESAVELFGRSDAQHGFAMAFVEGDDVRLWKAELLAGRTGRDEAAGVGNLLGRIHAASTAPDADRSPFRNRDDFRALRIEPYLSFAAGRHPAVAAELHELGDLLYASEQVLVHGDVSPKNVLLRRGRPVILDAECATLGDPCFDVSFCLNHLVLKAVHVTALRGSFAALVDGFWQAYVTHVTWEPVTDLERRVCRLLPALMLARIDGKSPVEYLTEDERERVRRLALGWVRQPVGTLASFVQELVSREKDIAT